MLAIQVAVMKGKGGVFTSLFHYARMWQANAVRSVCVYRGPGLEELRAAGIDVIGAPDTLQSPLFSLMPGMSSLRAEIRERGGDPVCAMVHSDRALRAVKHLFPQTVAMTRCHSDNTKHKRPADLVVTLNARQQEMVAAALPGVRVKMFGNPFAPDAAERGPNAEDAPGGRVRFNFIGRVEQVKDPLTLVRAFASARLPDSVELRIIGAGSQEEEVRAAASRAPAVSWAGWVDHPFALFDRGDVLVLPSEWESYSWVIREALYHHVPVIASDIYVHRDALGDGAFGWLFPVGDANALAALLERAVASLENLRAMSAAGREALLARYGAVPFWTALSHEIADIRTWRRT
jgi:glycosyltransferase involved in cell wall biosynthesis